MGMGAGLPQQSSPMDDYYRNYGAYLQSLLSGMPGGGAMGGAGPLVGSPDSAMDAAGRTADLGPDLYRNLGQPATPGAPAAQPPQATPQAAPGGPGQPQAAPGAAGAGPGAAPGAAPGQGDGKGSGTSLRDLWNSQDKATRQQYLDKLQDHLKATDESIDSAYQTMMKQLGGRPDPNLSKDEKGMLLMEFGMRMMEHSSGRQQGRDTGAAMGAAGVETIQSMRGLQGQHLARQQRYDQMQQQLAIAAGKEKSQLAARSALETGRDIRAFSAQDASLARTDTQQAGAAARQESRNTSAMDRTKVTEAGKDRRAQLAQQGVTHTFVDDQGDEIGVTRAGKTVNLGKAAPGSTGTGGRGGKGFASEANYRMYMDTYGKDENGQPLQGSDLDQVKKDALTYASNPHAFTLTDAQKRQMAEKSADNYIRSNQLSFAGMNDDEIAAKRTQFAEETFNRLKRNGSALPNAHANVPNKPKPNSALGGGDADASTTPTTPPAGKAAPQPALDYLKSNPSQAAAFAKKYGYVPPEFLKYLSPKPVSALH